jgi:hypothetical protein
MNIDEQEAEPLSSPAICIPPYITFPKISALSLDEFVEIPLDWLFC